MESTAPEQIRFHTEDIDEVVAALNRQELWPYGHENDEAGVPSVWEKSISTLEVHYASHSGRNLRAVAASSGTAAIHVALGGLQIPAGTEVIVPPITDMGSVMPVIFQNCIPVFADLDPHTGLLSAETIEEKISERTRAVIVVHLMGSPPDMDPIVELCRRKNIKLIEDAAQALGATYKGKPLGTLGDAGAFSLNSQKHITAGEGGFVLVEGEEDRIRCLNFSDKYRTRVRIPGNLPEEVIEALKPYRSSGLNYRMSDMEHALLTSQMARLDEVAAKFRTLGEHLETRMEAIDGITPQRRHREATSTYFYAMGRLHPSLAAKRPELISILRDKLTGKDKLGIGIGASYGRETVINTKVFQSKNFFANDESEAFPEQLWPAELVARKKFPDVEDSVFDYTHKNNVCPEAESWLNESLLIRFHDGHEITHMDAVADVLEAAIKQLSQHQSC